LDSPFPSFHIFLELAATVFTVLVAAVVIAHFGGGEGRIIVFSCEIAETGGLAIVGAGEMREKNDDREEGAARFISACDVIRLCPPMRDGKAGGQGVS
jgi:hypothetical protein